MMNIKKFPSRYKFDKTTPIEELVSSLLSEYPIISDRQGNIYFYNGMCWKKTEDMFIGHYLVTNGITSRNTITEVVSSCKQLNWHNDLLEWNKVSDFDIPFENGVLNIKTGIMRDHNVSDMLDYVLPHKYTRCNEAVPSLWLKCLEQWFYYDSAKDDTPKEERLVHSVEALQEFFGYLILAHTKYKKALVLYGPSNCGKSQILQVMEAIIGKAGSTSLPVNMFNDPQARSCLIGSRLNIVAEMSRYKQIPSEDFKMIVSTGDPVLMNEKYVKQYSHVPTTKHAFATNHIPNVESGAVGVWNRMLMLPMFNVIARDRQDPDLIKKLTSTESINGIIDWAIEGAQRLSEKEGRFKQPLISRIIVGDFELDSECGVKVFLEEYLEVYPGNAIPLRELKLEYESRMNEVKTMTIRQFSKLLREASSEHRPYEIKSKRYGNRTAKALFGYKLGASI